MNLLPLGESRNTAEQKTGSPARRIAIKVVLSELGEPSADNKINLCHKLSFLPDGIVLKCGCMVIE